MDTDIHRSLAGDLTDLARDLADGPRDLQDGLSALWRDFRLAVGSALGFSITILTDIHPPIVITQAVDTIDPDDVRSSLTAWMGRLERPNASWSITYYAEDADALHPFSADLALATGQPLDRHILDLDRPTAPVEPGITGLTSFSTINRAIGVLVAQGHTAEDARAHFTPGEGVTNLVKAVELIAAINPYPDGS